LETLLVFTNLPDRDAADRLAQALIARRLAACANVLADCTSVYRWQGKVETATEVPVLLKTTRRAYPSLESAIQELHPYDVPEIIAIPVNSGLPAYLQWVDAETQSEP